MKGENMDATERTRTCPAGEETYFLGNRCVYTGRIVYLSGGTFYEVKGLEGRHNGTLLVIKRAPKEV